MPQPDVIVIGAGHNGLVTASYLARAGKSVVVLERCKIVGGACVTAELVPGVRFSTGAYKIRGRLAQDLLIDAQLHVFLAQPGMLLQLGLAEPVWIGRPSPRVTVGLEPVVQRRAGHAKTACHLHDRAIRRPDQLDRLTPKLRRILRGTTHKGLLSSRDLPRIRCPRKRVKVIRSLFRFAPNLEGAIRAVVTLTPLDLEREYGLTGGNILHGAVFPNQLFASRPATSLGGCRGPIKGLYLCGAGTHPGGAVMGAAGQDAAAAVLDDISPGT